jgi:hypothetical protein
MNSSRWTGWVGFAGLLMIVIGAIDAFEGLIAIIRKQYYVVTSNQVIIFDVHTWGWLALIWGIVVMLAGLALLNRASWARWFVIIVGSINVIGQLGFVGTSAYPIWTLTIIAFTLVVLYALIVHWDEVAATA